MRILHIVTNMDRGGLETMIMNYYRHMDRDKIQFDFLVHRYTQAAYDQEIVSLGGKIFRLPRLNPLDPRYLYQLDRFFGEHREYRIVHCHLDCMSGIPLKAAKKHGIPVRIAHSHNSNQTKDWKYPIKLLCKQRIAPYATMLFACGKKAGDWMFPGKPCTVMPNAIDARKFRYDKETAAAVREKLGVKDALVVGHVGQFRPQKNHLFLLEAFGRLTQIHDNSILLLAGDGPGREAAEEKAEALGLRSKVMFLGNRPDIPELMQAMDVFVFPSKFEGLSVAAIEAQAAGLPCVVSDGVPAETIITDDVQQIPLTASADVWAESILKCSGHIRQDNYDRVAAAGFDIVAGAKWLKEIYSDAIRRN